MVHSLLDMRNVTPEVVDWLAKIGVNSPREFEKIGAKKLYLQLLDAGHAADNELRCRLLGAEQDLDWNIIAARDKRRAKSRFADVDEP